MLNVKLKILQWCAVQIEHLRNTLVDINKDEANLGVLQGMNATRLSARIKVSEDHYYCDYLISRWTFLLLLYELERRDIKDLMHSQAYFIAYGLGTTDPRLSTFFLI